MAVASMASQFLGSKVAASPVATQNVSRRALQVNALFKGTKKVAKSGTVKTGGSVKPQVNKSSRSIEQFGRELWLPNVDPPEWLDGSLPGDRGFDPLGLGKPASYLQVDLDELDQNADKNVAGDVIGEIKISGAAVESGSLQPYSEVFDLLRFRECEVIHGRWAMLAVLGALVAELNTGVSWFDAGKVELEGSSYLGLPLPFSITQLVIIETVLIGAIEFYRNGETDPEKRLYPGGVFDPLNFASDPDRAFKLKEAEIKHARLAMISALGFAVQAGFSGSTSPLANLQFLESKL